MFRSRTKEHTPYKMPSRRDKQIRRRICFACSLLPNTSPAYIYVHWVMFTGGDDCSTALALYWCAGNVYGASYPLANVHRARITQGTPSNNTYPPLPLVAYFSLQWHIVIAT